MSPFTNIKVKKMENVVSQISYGTSRGAVIFSRSSHEHHKNIWHFHELGINCRNFLCLSLIFDTITII